MLLRYFLGAGDRGGAVGKERMFTAQIVIQSFQVGGTKTRRERVSGGTQDVTPLFQERHGEWIEVSHQIIAQLHPMTLR